MTLDEAIRARHSLRAYTDQTVSNEVVNQILEAGRLAPSARNEQNWRFTAVKNPTLLQKLGDTYMGQTFAAKAPLVLAVWNTDKRVMACGQKASTVDCSIALSFMMLKVADLGLGGCWLGMYDAPKVVEILGLPADAEVVALMSIGYPAKEPIATPRKALDEVADIRE